MKDVNSLSAANYLVCYDIKDKRRLARVHTLLLSVGIPLQYSIFYLKVPKALLTGTIKKAERFIDETQDDVRIYVIDKFDISVWKKAATDKLNQALLVM